jgi:hypothetical protein
MSSGWRSAPPPPMPRRVEHPFWSRVLDAVALFFSGFCHTLGAAFLRLLSTIVLVGGIAGSVALNIMGYYYLGVLNPHPLLAALLYVPTLAVRPRFFYLLFVLRCRDELQRVYSAPF